MISKEIKASVKQLILKNKTDSALQQLFDFLEKNNTKQKYTDQVFLMQARHKKIMEQYRKGTFTMQEMNAEQNKINDALLSLVNELDQTNIAPINSNAKKRVTTSAWFFIGLAVMIISGALIYWQVNKNVKDTETTTTTTKVETPPPPKKETTTPPKVKEELKQTPNPKSDIVKKATPEKPTEPEESSFTSSPIDVGIIAYIDGKKSTALAQGLANYYNPKGTLTVTNSFAAPSFSRAQFEQLLKTPQQALDDPNINRLKTLALIEQKINGTQVDIIFIQINTSTGVIEDRSTSLTLPSNVIPGKEQALINQRLLKYLRK